MYQDQSSIKALIAALFVLGIFGVWMIQQTIVRHIDWPEREVPITGVVSNANRHVAVRLPVSPAGAQEQIIVEGNPPHQMTTHREVVDKNRHFGDSIVLTDEQWFAIAHLRDTWCAEAPDFHSLSEQDPLYDVGLWCNPEDFIGRRTRRITVPVDELPPELVELIELAPSPTCDDPFCGWPTPYPQSLQP